jgi:hypothetical protein
MNRPLAVNHHSFARIGASNRSNHRPGSILVAEASKTRLGVLGLSEAGQDKLETLVEGQPFVSLQGLISVRISRNSS